MLVLALVIVGVGVAWSWLAGNPIAAVFAALPLMGLFGFLGMAMMGLATGPHFNINWVGTLLGAFVGLGVAAIPSAVREKLRVRALAGSGIR